MLKKIFTLALAIQSLTSLAHANNRNFLMQKAEPQHIFVNNRILAKVNGKPISVIDLMKKMDMIFYRQFPQYSSSIEARYQFYNMNWKHVLEELVEKELMMADAEEVKMEVSHGDIRQEMEKIFGPNIIANLDKAGLTYDEAWKMVKEEQLLKRMMISRVNSKAVRSVTPADIRAAYEEYSKENINPDTWRYEVISIQGKDPSICAEAANYAYHLVTEAETPIQSLGDKLKERPYISDSTKYNVSEEYIRTSKEISESYREILSSLEPGAFSKPISQESRSKNSKVFRIFHLKEFTPGGSTPFSNVEIKLKNKLIDKKVEEEGEQYIARLRKHFDVQDGRNHQLFTEDFHPFSLK